MRLTVKLQHMLVMVAALSSTLITATASATDSATLNANELLFVSSGRWQQFESDIRNGIFRLYAFAINAKHEPVDMPNLLVLNCGEPTPYLIPHFAENYAFTSFKASDWQPETTLYARNEKSTFHFKAELNRNEIFVDLPGNEANVDALLASPSIEFRFGPSAGDHAVLAIDGSLAQSERDFIDNNAGSNGRGKVVATSDWKDVGPCKPRSASASAPSPAVATPTAEPALDDQRMPTQDDPVFVLENGGVTRVGNPEQSAKVGETLSLAEVGRRFPDSSVSAAYEQGEDEIEYFKVANGSAEVHLHYDETSKITRIETHSPNIADANGVQVGGSVAAALGSRAFCNTYMEDQPPYCQAAEQAGIRYDVAQEDACSLPELRAEIVDIPPCLKVAAISLSAAPTPARAQFSFAEFPAPAFKGKTVLPKFKGRDKEFKDYRTRIVNALKEGPNFAGEFSLVQIGCGTGCSFVFVASNRTGEVFAVPVGGEDNLYLDLAFEKGSRLLATQWASEKNSTCNIEWFEWTGRAPKRLAQTPIGATDACFKPIAENLGR